MVKDTKEIKLYTEIESGDYLVYVEQDNFTRYYKVLTSNFLRVLLDFVESYLLEKHKTVLTLVKYEDVLTQKRIKEITIEK